jgi:SAM-dependent methyltransferase
MSSAVEPWFVSAFRADYLAVYPHRDLESARREVDGLIASGVGGRVLDLGCGFGRHTLAMRERGLEAFGLDLSADLLAHARELPGAAGIAGRLVRGDARRLPFLAARFDTVTVLFSSFGYFGDRGDREVLAEVARVLRPGGRLVLDLMNARRVRAELVPESLRERDGFQLLERRALVDQGRSVEKEVQLRAPDGGERSWVERVRLYEHDEIARLLAASNLDLTRTMGDFDGSPPSASSPRWIVHAGR